MVKYNLNSTCSKCGVSDASTEHTYGTMRRTCRNCGFGWFEEPLDGLSDLFGLNIITSDSVPPNCILFIDKNTQFKIKNIRRF